MKQLSLFIVSLSTIFISQAQPGSTIAESEPILTVPVTIAVEQKSQGTQSVLPMSYIISRPIPGMDNKYGQQDHKGIVGKSALIGFGVGALIGLGVGAVGAAISSAFNGGAGVGIVAGSALICGSGGAIIGALIGLSLKNKFIIGERRSKFRQLQTM